MTTHREVVGEGGGGGCEYPPLVMATVEAVFEDIRTYVRRRQNIFAKYIATQLIIELCERFIRSPGDWVSWRWWYQDGLDLEEAKEITSAELDREEAQSKEDELTQEDMTAWE